MYPYEHSNWGRMVILALKSPALVPQISISPNTDLLHND